MPKTLKLILCLTLLWSYTLPTAFASPDLPPAWDEHVTLDQFFNVYDRADEVMNFGEAAPLQVYSFDIPIDGADMYVSRYLDEETKKLVLITKNGVQYVRFFIVDSPRMPLERMREKYGTPQQIYMARKLQSHSTYVLWDPSKGRKSEIFCVKMRIEVGDEVHNSSQNAEMAVRHSDYIEDILLKDGSPKASFLPERFGAALKVEGLEYAYSIRSMKPINGFMPGTKLLPLHGYLQDKIFGFQGEFRNRQASEDWIINSYLPKLAEFLAVMHFSYGLYPVAHTQNLLVQVNAQNEISGFVARDANDVMIDPFIHATQGKAIDPVARETISEINNFFVDEDVKTAHYSGHHFWYYDSQSFRSFEPDASKRFKLMGVFFHHYRRATERILGSKLHFPPEREVLMERARRGFDISRQWAGRRSELLYIVPHWIFNAAREQLVPKITPEMYNYHQGVLRGIYKQHKEFGWISFITTDAADVLKRYDLKFAYDGKGIYITRTNWTIPVAYLDSLTPEDHERIKRYQISCDSHLKPKPSKK